MTALFAVYSYKSIFLVFRNHYNWLQLDRRVLEHEIPKRSGPLILHFSVRSVSAATLCRHYYIPLFTLTKCALITLVKTSIF